MPLKALTSCLMPRALLKLAIVRLLPGSTQPPAAFVLLLLSPAVEDFSHYRVGVSYDYVTIAIVVGFGGPLVPTSLLLLRSLNQCCWMPSSRDSKRVLKNSNSALKNRIRAFKNRNNATKSFRATAKQKACLDSKRVPKARAYTAWRSVSQRTTLTQMGK